jgi:alpha-L-fucosidase
MNHFLLSATLLLSPLLASAAPAGADLSMVPQLHETKEQRDERMQWFRDGKYGMFIHWGPCTIGAKEIGWDREGNRPWDINKHGPRTSDPEYDNYYKSFNPVKFDADALVQLAKKSGMKYMVLVTKHHDGFSMFDTKQSDYSIMHTPYGRDVVKAFADACHRHGMKMGLYYSTRDWYHPDYLVGDNKKYDAWYQEQIRELLTNYGNVDVMWFDHVGGRDWSKWRFDDLFSMMYRLQPGMLVNNRAAKFCGPVTPEDKGPATKELETMTKGDYYTPEGRIGSLDIQDDWESCIHIGQGWSYRGEEGFQTPEDCIKMLVSCTTGGGNLLLNVGPRADGTLTDGEFQSVKAVGAWLEKYGDAIYGTRGGPYKNGRWGGSCHKGNKIFLHLYQHPEGGRLEFDPLPRKVLSARTLDGAPVDVAQSEEKLSLGIAKEAQASPVTVVELTIDNPIEPGTLFGRARVISDNMSEFGHDLGKLATLSLSSTSEHDNPEDHEKLFRGERPQSGYAFHTEAEENPTALIDLQRIKNINAILIENRPDDRRSEGLIVSISKDGKQWDQIWQAPEWKEKWLVPVGHFHAGITVPGRNARFIRVETKGNHPRPLILQRMTILGD